ncbi:MAG: hypothetical protein WCJ64_04890 [Rhodospirillaceae bacterium]
MSELDESAILVDTMESFMCVEFAQKAIAALHHIACRTADRNTQGRFPRKAGNLIEKAYYLAVEANAVFDEHGIADQPRAWNAYEDGKKLGFKAAQFHHEMKSRGGDDDQDYD